MPEFTGERVIPELVETDLLNEHLARYRFAARFVEGRRVLDAGCGTGYGTASMVSAQSVTGVDIAEEAVSYASQRYTRPGVRFIRASCGVLPFADAAFDVITAFEVIEHLSDWQAFLAESKRVLRSSGSLIVSTPNRSYYSETRGESGPNPFHVHEFEHEEFRAALQAAFPHVTIWTQNRNECFLFAPAKSSGSALESGGDINPDSAHFFVAVCSESPIADAETFAWVPTTANLLREREQHIAKLQGELTQKNEWLQKVVAEHAELQRHHEELNAEMQQKNSWATQLNLDIAARDRRIGELQEEVEQRLAWLSDMEAQFDRARTRVAQLDLELAEQFRTLEDRTAWAHSLEEKVESLDEALRHRAEQLQMIAHSRWVRLGRKLNIGPSINGQ